MEAWETRIYPGFHWRILHRVGEGYKHTFEEGVALTANFSTMTTIWDRKIKEFAFMKINKWDLIKLKSFCTKETMKSENEVAQLCPTLCDAMDCSPPGSPVHGILQARILEWVAISFSRGSSWPRGQTQVSCIAGRRFNLWATREARWKDSLQNGRK